MGGCSRGQKYEGRADFDGITHIWQWKRLLPSTAVIAENSTQAKIIQATENLAHIRVWRII